MLQLTENQQLNDYTTLALTVAPTMNSIATDGAVKMTVSAEISRAFIDRKTGIMAIKAMPTPKTFGYDGLT